MDMVPQFFGGVKFSSTKLYGHPIGSTQIVICAQLNGHNDSVVPRVVNALESNILLLKQSLKKCSQNE